MNTIVWFQVSFVELFWLVQVANILCSLSISQHYWLTARCYRFLEHFPYMEIPRASFFNMGSIMDFEVTVITLETW